VAILGADLSLDWFQQKIDKRDWEIFANEWGGGHDKKEVQEMDERRQNRYLNRKPYSFLISGKGTFIVHPDRRRIIRDNYSSIANASSDTTAAVIGRKMMAGADCVEDDENIQECEDFDGCKCYVFYTPIKHTDWSMALVVPNQGIELIAYLVGGVLVFLIIVALVVVWIVSRITIRRAVNPLKQLASSADEVAKGNFDAALPTIKHNDEIRLLRNSFEDMLHSLTKYVNELQTTTASKAAMEKELKVAHDIQMSMLPKIFPPFPNRKDIDVSAILSPAKDVGGDLFDFYIRDEQLFFCIGDVSGKGVPASLVMAVTRSLFRNVSAHVAEPHLIVTALNEALAEGNEQCMFATLFVGVLDLATGRLRYCNAGHDAPLLIGDGVGTLPCDSNLPIGVMPDFEFSQQETDIFHQTTIFLYTDGLNEAEDIRQAQFGNKRVIEMAEKLLAEGNNQPETVIREMVEAVHSFVGKAEQSDDLTMLAIQYKSSQTDE
jgi:sigma-B regulation protein RsbU (phosphoserine phosphatase)